MKKRQLPALTGMRFFLALWVVIYHQSESLVSWLSATPSVLSVIQTGYAAVGVFFILSGFVLTYNYDLSTLGEPRNAKRFGVARFSRIFPAYLAGLLLLLPFALYRMLHGIDGGAMSGTGNFVLNLTLLQAWFPAAALTWNYPGWSLSNEAFFYAVLPFIGLSILRAVGSKPRNALFCALVFWGLALAAPAAAVWLRVPAFGTEPATNYQLHGAGPIANVIRYNPLLRLPEFCLGVVLGLLYRALPENSRVWGRGSLFYLPGIAMILLTLAFANRIPHPLVSNGLLDPASALVIFGLAVEGGWLVRLLSTRPLIFLGNASYTMYILHVPVFGWLALVYLRLLYVAPFGVAWVGVYVVAVILCSSVFYQWVEEPAHRWLRRKLNGPVERPAAAIAATLE